MTIDGASETASLSSALLRQHRLSRKIVFVLRERRGRCYERMPTNSRRAYSRRVRSFVPGIRRRARGSAADLGDDGGGGRVVAPGRITGKASVRPQGLTTRPTNRTLPVGMSRMTKKNGRSTVMVAEF
jgi:hypothetical protein